MKPLIFIGIDSATWDLILPWVNENELPGFSKLINESTIFKCQSIHPPYTASAWPTMFTGLSPAQHGIYDFRYIKNQDIHITSPQHIYPNYYWHLASKKGLSTCVYNIPMTYPAPPVNGLSVSSFTAPNLDSDFVYPKAFKNKLLNEFPDYQIIAPGKYNQFKPSENVEYSNNILHHLKQKIEVSKWLFKQQKWDIFITNILEIDHLQHFFWDQLQSHTESNPILSGYQIIDKYISELFSKYSKSHHIVLASDHGAGIAKNTIFLNRWLEKKGYLIYKSNLVTNIKMALRSNLLHPKLLAYIAYITNATKSVQKINLDNQNKLVRKIFLDIIDVDLNLSTAYSFGEYSGRFLTKKNNKLANKIVGELKNDFSNNLSVVKLSKDLYEDKIPKSIPDIQVLFDNGATTGSSVYAFHGPNILTKTISGKTGNHRLNGVFAINQKLNIDKSNCSIYDIFPTLCDLSNIDYDQNKIKGNSLVKHTDISNISL